MRELGWVSQEEDRCIVGNNIPVTLLGPELHREPTRVTGAIVRAGLTADSRETYCDGASLALLEDIRQAEIFQGICGGIVAVGSSTNAVLLNVALLEHICSTYPLACTTRSGMRSRSKCERRSTRWKSWSRRGPFSPARCVSYGCGYGTPFEVV